MAIGTAIAMGIVLGIAVLAVGAGFAGWSEGAITTVAALGCTALGLMVLADLLLIPGLTLPPGGLTQYGILVIGFQIGAIALALLALVLVLMSGLTGVVWAARHRRGVDLVMAGGALVAAIAGMVLTAASFFGVQPAATGALRNALLFAGFGLGTLAPALITLRAMPIARRRAHSPPAQSRGAA